MFGPRSNTYSNHVNEVSDTQSTSASNDSQVRTETSFDSGFYSPARQLFTSTECQSPDESDNMAVYHRFFMSPLAQVNKPPGNMEVSEDVVSSMDDWDRNFIEQFEETLFNFAEGDVKLSPLSFKLKYATPSPLAKASFNSASKLFNDVTPATPSMSCSGTSTIYSTQCQLKKELFPPNFQLATCPSPPRRKLIKTENEAIAVKKEVVDTDSCIDEAFASVKDRSTKRSIYSSPWPERGKLSVARRKFQEILRHSVDKTSKDYLDQNPSASFSGQSREPKPDKQKYYPELCSALCLNKNKNINKSTHTHRVRRPPPKNPRITIKVLPPPSTLSESKENISALAAQSCHMSQFCHIQPKGVRHTLRFGESTNAGHYALLLKK